MRDPEQELSGPDYFAFAVRMSAFSGVLAARAAQYEERRREQAREAADMAVIFAQGEHVEV
jgi:hypothetical protein